MCDSPALRAYFLIAKGLCPTDSLRVIPMDSQCAMDVRQVACETDVLKPFQNCMFPLCMFSKTLCPSPGITLPAAPKARQVIVFSIRVSVGYLLLAFSTCRMLHAAANDDRQVSQTVSPKVQPSCVTSRPGPLTSGTSLTGLLPGSAPVAGPVLVDVPKDPCDQAFCPFGGLKV